MSTETNVDTLDFTGEETKISSGLNTLTILTMIGCALGFLGGIWNFFAATRNYEKTKEMLESGKMDEAPSWLKGMINPDMLAMQHKMMENKFPIFILTLISVALCLYGTLEMRKRKKQGFTLWLIGELLPVGSIFLFIGLAPFKGFGLFYIIIPIVFIILYSMKKKELVL